jgi:hypothetical protein
LVYNVTDGEVLGQVFEEGDAGEGLGLGVEGVHEVLVGSHLLRREE